MIIICIYKLFIIVEMRENEITILKNIYWRTEEVYIWAEKDSTPSCT